MRVRLLQKYFLHRTFGNVKLCTVLCSVAKMGAPTKYNTELADEILLELATTLKSFGQICEDAGISARTGWSWRNSNPDFQERYEQARASQTELGFDRLREIADEPLPEVAVYAESGEYLGTKVDAGVSMAEMQRRKLQVGVLQFGLAKLQAKRFGDNRSVDLNVKVRKVVSNDQFQRLLDAAAAAPKAVEAEDTDYEEMGLLPAGTPHPGDDFAGINDADDFEDEEDYG